MFNVYHIVIRILCIGIFLCPFTCLCSLFQRRFGLDSSPYNIPLYFSAERSCSKQSSHPQQLKPHRTHVQKKMKKQEKVKAEKRNKSTT